MTPVFLSPQNLSLAPVSGASPATLAAAGNPVEDFSVMLGRAAQEAADKLKTGEATASAGIMGKASVQQVAEAVMAAEQAMQASIALRDKAVAAYLELSRMQI